MGLGVTRISKIKKIKNWGRCEFLKKLKIGGAGIGDALAPINHRQWGAGASTQ
jgi:hypothetical protein